MHIHVCTHTYIFNMSGFLVFFSLFCCFFFTSFLMSSFHFTLFSPWQLIYTIYNVITSHFSSEWLWRIQEKKLHVSHFPYMTKCFMYYRWKQMIPKDPHTFMSNQLVTGYQVQASNIFFLASFCWQATFCGYKKRINHFIIFIPKNNQYKNIKEITNLILFINVNKCPNLSQGALIS